MTYKTRQEVLRAAAEWMDVCEAAMMVPARCKISGIAMPIHCVFDFSPDCYEFPLALLEGKEVWVGNELYWDDGSRVTVTEAWNINANWKLLSWNPPKPATVMVEMLVEDADYYAKERELPLDKIEAMIERRASACKKALEIPK